MKSIQDILDLKIDNLIQRLLLEKNSYKQKLMSEYEELKKEKQVEMDKLIVKYKNKKLELDIRQKREKNLNDNDNLLKANIYSSNLTNMSMINSNNNLQNKSFNKSAIKFSFDNVNELKNKYFISNKIESSNKNINNNLSVSISKKSLKESKSERNSSIKQITSKNNQYETNFKILNKNNKTNKNKNVKLTISQHLLKESDLEHKKPFNIFNRRSSQTKNIVEKSNYSKKVLEYNENAREELQTRGDGNLNFAVNFLNSPQDIKKEHYEDKFTIDMSCNKTGEFIHKDISKNDFNINSMGYLKNQEIENKINYYEIDKQILEEKFKKNVNISEK